jgi:hypothetical protein
MAADNINGTRETCALEAPLSGFIFFCKCLFCIFAWLLADKRLASLGIQTITTPLPHL